MNLTPISEFDGWCAKREDMPGWLGLDHPSGSKVRQYLEMSLISPGIPMIVGCSSYSCMQIYVASAAKLSKVPAYIHVPLRSEPTEATQYALSMGAEVKYVPRPAWPSVLRKRAREHAKELGKTVKWNPDWAVKDTMAQCANLPRWVKRVVVPTGSGLTASGVLAGLAVRGLRPTVVIVTVSAMAKAQTIFEKASELAYGVHGSLFPMPNMIWKSAQSKYKTPVMAHLPDGTPLDPWYAAKALEYVQKGDCLWVPGLRPVCAFPAKLQETFASWKGFV